MDQAKEELGGYFRHDVDHYVGDYLFIRPSSSDPFELQMHAFHIGWNTEQSAMELRQSRTEHSPQVGLLSIPRSSMHIFITSTDGGWAKLMAVSQLDIENKMF